MSGRKSGGRRGQRSAARGGLQQSPRRALRRNYAPIEVIDAEAVERIHEASLRILERIGIEVMLPEAREIFVAAGAELGANGTRVHLPAELLMQAMASAPAEFTLHARNPQNDLRFGADHLAFCAVASAPNAFDSDGGRRAGNRTDYRNFLRLSQYFNIVHLNGGYPVEPVDIHASVRHLDCLADMVTLTDKPFHAYSLGRERNLDGIEIARIARGISSAQLLDQPSLFSIINTNSPLQLDQPMLIGIIEMARHGQLVVITPFTLAGAMAPVTLAGALAQQNAEALAGMALTQLVRPGAPVIYGGFTSNVDMKSGAPAFGTPEYVRAAQIGGQLARRYRVPYRSSNVNAANVTDMGQAAWESSMALWGAVMGGANMLMHGAGWMEGGLCASFEKFVIDCDLLQMMAEYLQPVVVDDDSLALDAIEDVGPGGHFFGTAHTQARYEHAFYAPLVSDWRNYETWCEAGSPTALQRANGLYRRALQEYVEPAIDPAIREELEAFVAKRKEAGGAPTDF